MSRINAYSIEIRRPDFSAYSHAASSTSRTFQRVLTGTSVSRSSSSGACSETASRHLKPSSANRSIAGTSPTVETVIPRCDSPSPSGSGSVSRRIAPTTRL